MLYPAQLRITDGRMMDAIIQFFVIVPSAHDTFIVEKNLVIVWRHA